MFFCLLNILEKNSNGNILFKINDIHHTKAWRKNSEYEFNLENQSLIDSEQCFNPFDSTLNGLFHIHFFFRSNPFGEIKITNKKKKSNKYLEKKRKEKAQLV